MKKILLSLFSFSLALGAMAQDAPFTSVATSISDGYVDVGNKDQVSSTMNTGGSTIYERLIVSGKDRVAYIKFDLNSSTKIPTGKTISDYDINSAQLRLVGRDAGTEAQSYNMHCALVADNNWESGSLSWNNQPDESSWGASINAIPGFDDSLDPKEKRGPYLIDIKEAIKTAVAEGKTTVTLVLYQDDKDMDGKNYVTYYSSAKGTASWAPQILFQLQLKSATGIENETADNNGLTVNPTVVNAGEKISIQCDDATSNFEVYNVAGAHMLTASNNEVSTAGFQSGVYILTSAGKSARFIVK